MSYSPLGLVVTGTPIASAWGNGVRDDLLETGPAKVTTAGDLLVASGANSLARLAKGTDGQSLVMAAGAPAWGTPTLGRWAFCCKGSAGPVSYGGTRQTVTLDTLQQAIGGPFSLSSNALVLPATGVVLVTFHVQWVLPVAAGTVFLYGRQNTIDVTDQRDMVKASGDQASQEATKILAVTAADTLSIQVQQNTGSNANFQDGGLSTWLSAVYLA